MRRPRLFAVLTLLGTLSTLGAANAGSAAAAAPRVGYIPAPSAQSPGRPAVLARLRQLGKEEFQLAKELAEDDCLDHTFEAKVLLDTPALYSLELISYRTCFDRATEGGSFPRVFDMQAGREYDISRLYRVRDAKGALIAPLRRLVASRMDPREQEMTPQEIREAVETDLTRGKPYLFVTRTGLRVWPEAFPVWLDDVVLTWADLRPYLDVAEARRLGWSAAAPVASGR